MSRAGTAVGSPQMRLWPFVSCFPALPLPALSRFRPTAAPTADAVRQVVSRGFSQGWPRGWVLWYGMVQPDQKVICHSPQLTFRPIAETDGQPDLGPKDFFDAPLWPTEYLSFNDVSSRRRTNPSPLPRPPPGSGGQVSASGEGKATTFCTPRRTCCPSPPARGRRRRRPRGAEATSCPWRARCVPAASQFFFCSCVFPSSFSAPTLARRETRAFFFSCAVLAKLGPPAQAGRLLSLGCRCGR